MSPVCRTRRRALGLALALAAGLAGCATAPSRPPAVPAAQAPAPRATAPLSADELALARTAWRYFEHNTQPATGLVNAAHDYPSTTLWDAASAMAAVVAAHGLGLITPTDADARLAAMLATLRRLPLFRGELPNKAYDTRSAQPVNYANQPAEIGFSALDLGRMLIWLAIVRERYPQHAAAADAVVAGWSFCGVLDTCGSLFGAVPTADGRVLYLQEGRLGYEEYAAVGFGLWGFDVARAAKPEPFAVADISGVRVPYDARDPRELGAHNYVVTESAVLDGMELGWRAADGTPVPWRRDFADAIYAAQAARYRQTGILTARTEHQLAGAPYFVYDTVYADGFPWNTITDQGAYVPQYAAVAAKAAVGMWALWDTPYTTELFGAVGALADPATGVLEGRFESGGGRIDTYTANNNGIILEALLYKQQGPLLRDAAHATAGWEATMGDAVNAGARCRPSAGQAARCTGPPHPSRACCGERP